MGAEKENSGNVSAFLIVAGLVWWIIAGLLIIYLLFFVINEWPWNWSKADWFMVIVCFLLWSASGKLHNVVNDLDSIRAKLEALKIDKE